MCHCNRDVESTSHSTVPHLQLNDILLSTLNDVDQKFLENTDPTIISLLPFGGASFDRASNTQILSATMKSYQP